jgi:hemoglobin
MEKVMTETLYVRLGGADAITRIASDLVDNHMANPLIGKRFAGSDRAAMKKKAADFFSMGSGGPDTYDGLDMLSAHKHMNISDIEYMAAVDDLMIALSNADVGDREKADVLYIFHTLRPNVVGV